LAVCSCLEHTPEPLSSTPAGTESSAHNQPPTRELPQGPQPQSGMRRALGVAPTAGRGHDPASRHSNTCQRQPLAGRTRALTHSYVDRRTYIYIRIYSYIYIYKSCRRSANRPRGSYRRGHDCNLVRFLRPVPLPQQGGDATSRRGTAKLVDASHWPDGRGQVHIAMLSNAHPATIAIHEEGIAGVPPTAHAVATPGAAAAGLYALRVRSRTRSRRGMRLGVAAQQRSLAPAVGQPYVSIDI